LRGHHYLPLKIHDQHKFYSALTLYQTYNNTHNKPCFYFRTFRFLIKIFSKFLSYFCLFYRGGSTELFLPSIRKSKPKLIELITSKKKLIIELLNRLIKERRQKETNRNIFTLHTHTHTKNTTHFCWYQDTDTVFFIYIIIESILKKAIKLIAKENTDTILFYFYNYQEYIKKTIKLIAKENTDTVLTMQSSLLASYT